MTIETTQTRGCSPEMELLCACVRPAGATGPSVGMLLESPIDWGGYLALATNHHVIPLAYRALKAASRDSRGIPRETLGRMQSLYLSIAAHNLRAVTNLARIQKRMAASGIRAIPIKGPALAALAYGDIGLRQFEDLDIIVQSSQLLLAIALLERDGYATRELPPHVSRERYLAWLQDWSLSKPGDVDILDIKPVLIAHTLCGPASADYMAAACRPLAAGNGLSLLAPGVEAMLLAVCIDGANEMWFKLSSVADVGALLASGADADWAGLLRAADDLGQRRSLLVGVLVAEALLGCPVPPAFEDAVRSDASVKWLANLAATRLRCQASRRPSVARQGWFAIQSRDRLRDAWRFVWRLLFVPGAFDLSVFPLPHALYGLHSLARPFRLAWDALGRGGRPRRLNPMPPAAGVSLQPQARIL